MYDIWLLVFKYVLYVHFSLIITYNKYYELVYDSKPSRMLKSYLAKATRRGWQVGKHVGRQTGLVP